MRATILLVLLIGICPCSGTQVGATGHPDLTGIWKTNNQKSHYAHHAGMFLAGLNLQQQGNSLRETIMDTRPVEQGPPRQVVYSLDGSETATKIRGEEYRTTATWEGQTLVIVWEVNRGDVKSALKRELLLSSDGKTLTVKLYSPADRKDPNQVLVLDKANTTKDIGFNP